MDEPRFYQKPWFYYLSWSIFWGAVYSWQIRHMGGFSLNMVNVFKDGIIFAVGLLFWMAFFSQFVLPVRTIHERKKIFDRLVNHLSGYRGPAIFIENGRVRERQDKQNKDGPGVLWLDSASAAVTRSATRFLNTIGPGVHFTQKGETIASAIDLHLQTQKLGPREEEDVFAPKPSENGSASEIEKYNRIQKRRREVAAWTRDGIEVVPNISVLFKIDAEPIKDADAPGSRFGYNKQAVGNAIRSEGINPDQPDDAPRRRVRWNQLPSMIAADLWREYLSKFTLAELFEANRIVPSPQSPEPEPAAAETQALFHPLIPSSGIDKTLAGMLHELNLLLMHWANRCESVGKPLQKSMAANPKHEPPLQKTPGLETALDTIMRMVKTRMTEAEVDVLDNSGKLGQGKIDSLEYKILHEHGIKVMSVSIKNLRFETSIEDQLVNQWNTTWLENARAERDRIERQRGFVSLNGQVKAAQKYAQSLSSNLLKLDPGEDDPKETLKTLLLRSRDELIRNDRMHHRASMEREELEGIIQWVERNEQ